MTINTHPALPEFEYILPQTLAKPVNFYPVILVKRVRSSEERIFLSVCGMESLHPNFWWM